MSSTFGFEVEYEPGYFEGDASGWRVKLPHQCDAWRIDADSDYDDPTPQAEALARLGAFIAEAQAAREALARGEQYPPTART